MTYDLYLHEIEHGPAVVPGPLPPNAGQLCQPKPPGWWVNPKCTIGPEPFGRLWGHLERHRRLTLDQMHALAPKSAYRLLTALAWQSRGALTYDGGPSDRVWYLYQEDGWP